MKRKPSDYTIKDIMELVKKPDSEIIEIIGMEYLPLIVYTFEKKYSGQVSFIDIGKDCMIRYGSTNIANMSYLATHLHFLTIANNNFTLEGNISLPYSYRNRCKHFALINGKEIPLELYDAQLDQTIEGEIYESRQAFNICFPISDYMNEISNEMSISFVTYTDGIRSICGKLNSYRFMPVADILPHQYAHINNYVTRIIKNHISCCIADDEGLKEVENTYCNDIKSSNLPIDIKEEIIQLRRIAFLSKTNKTKTWLFMDRLEKADDNGEVLFRYINEHKPRSVNCFYIISNKSDDFNRMKKLGNIVPALSKEHKKLLLIADYIFSSQLNGFMENPFGRYSEYYRDLYHRARVVFLQHGVTKDDQSGFLNHFSQNIYAIIASSEREKEEFSKKIYGFKINQIWNTGLARFDNLNLINTHQKRILIMPTWRRQLMELKEVGENGIRIWRDNGLLSGSQYIRAYKSLLNNRLLKILCYVFGYKIIFSPHPLMKPYEDLFCVPKWIEKRSDELQYSELISKCDLLITDYSSIAFDFAYLNKKIIYYQFDKDIFYASHTYKKGYFDYEKDGFGMVVYDERSLVLNILLWIVNQKSPNKNHKAQEYFTHQDKNNCYRILKCLLNEEAEKNEFNC